VAEAEGSRLLGGEDEGHLRRTLAVQAAHRDLGTAARVRQSLALRHGLGGATGGAGKALLPRDPFRAAFLPVRKPCFSGHATSLSRRDARLLPAACARASVTISKVAVALALALPNRYRGVALSLPWAGKL
jgi:hypothetical protein